LKLTDNARFDTVCIHAGQEPEPATGAVTVPIFQTATYVQEGLGRHKGYEYARTHNPTRAALEANIAALEGGRAAFAFASGMAAESAVMSLLEAGDHVVVTENTYGGTFRLFDKVLRKYALSFSYVDTGDIDAVEQAIGPRTRMLFVETPTNPVLTLTDLARVSSAARERGVRVVVDNTFASPYNQRPIDLGADIVVHSTTKYLNGHSDSVGGVVVATRDDDIEWLRFVQNAVGAILSPFDSWLVLRGTKTLALRMERHNTNGQAVAEFLAGHPRVKAVRYPGLPSHPQHELARSQMRGFTGMVTFDLDSLDAVHRFLAPLRLFALAESLGGVESLISHPAVMTHASVPADTRVKLGIGDATLRLSVGVEDIADLVEDLERGLAAI
jgi:cystathionine beta-lyase/cystathionine gamma-synthase